MKILKIIVHTCSAGIVSLVLLSAFVMVYDYSGVHVNNLSNSTDYKWSANQYKSTMSEGLAWIRFDSNGFNNPDNAKSNYPDILLIGSSHMEAVNIDESENVAAIIRNEIPSMSIYNIGISGHTIYRCAKNLASAVKEYSPQKYIIIETDSVNLEPKLMEQVINNTFADIPSYDSGCLYYIQKYCPAAKSIYKQVDNWRSADTKTNLNNSSEESLDIDNSQLLMMFLSKIKKDSGNCKVIIVYHPKSLIDENGKIIVDDDGIDEFAQTCGLNDISFIDMTNSFDEFYRNEHILAHGFCNTAVGEGHLNKYGHKLIAEKVVELILEDQS